MTSSTTQAAAADGYSQSPQEQKQHTSSTGAAYRILAVYKFVDPKLSKERLQTLKSELEQFCRAHSVRGSLLLAPEGINGTIDYPHDRHNQASHDADPVLKKLQTIFPGIRTRLSYSPNGHVFYRFKVKIKSDILTCQCDEGDICLDPTRQVGTYVKPGPEWDALLEDPTCLVVDARNEYEVRIGSFRNAQNPHTTTFSGLIPWMQHALQKQKPQKIAMFCTGGIRCEKASAAALDLVHDNKNSEGNNIPVYHLEGGILAYLDTVPKEQSLFHGDCYVFDQRVAVTHGLQPVAEYSMCHACRAPLKSEEQDGHPDYITGKQCLYCKNATTAKQQQRFDARQRQIQLAQQKGLLHIHDPKEKVLSVLGQGSEISSR